MDSLGEQILIPGQDKFNVSDINFLPHLSTTSADNKRYIQPRKAIMPKIFKMKSLIIEMIMKLLDLYLLSSFQFQTFTFPKILDVIEGAVIVIRV